MKKVKTLALFLVFSFTISLFAGFSYAKSGDVVKITLINSKAEIQTQLEAAAKAFSAENPGITIDITPCSAGKSPFEVISAMYAAGNAPTLSMLDPSDISKFQDKFADLSKEKWVKDATARSLDVATTSKKQVIAFPLTVEGYGFIYNKAVLDKALGYSFDPKTVKTTKDLESIFKKVKAKGIDAIAVSPMDWSLGAHYLGMAYDDQSKDSASVQQFVNNLQAGKVSLKTNKVFNGLMDTFDVMMKYNNAKNDPLGPTYDKAPVQLATGKAAFWFMGNWAWPDIMKANPKNTQYGFMPVPISNTSTDYGNSGIPVGVTKFIGVDKTENTSAQQAAAKKFLEWLVYSKNGQDSLVNKCSIIPAFKNITLQPQDPLAKSIKQYMTSKNTLEFIQTLPSDHWSVVGASMQKYLAGKATRAQLIDDIQKYWKNLNN